MPKAVIKVNDDPRRTREVVTDEWDEFREAVCREIDGAFGPPETPEEITISITGMSMTEWNALPEDERRDLQEYGGEG